jgi:hypothetical protein
VDSDKDHIFDLLVFQDVPDFITAIADEIVLRINGDGCILSLPRQSGVASFCRQGGSPCGMFGGVIIFTAVGLIDGVECLFFGGYGGAPEFDIGRSSGSDWKLQRAESGGVLSVSGHAVTGGVNNGGTAVAAGRQQLIHAWQKFGHAAYGIEAVVSVPDIADDDSRAGGFPLF